MSEKWYFGGLRIRTTSVYVHKYMGLLLTPKLPWSASKYKLASQAKKAIFSIKSYQYKFGYFLHNEYFKLFDAMVLPFLTFDAELWGYEYSDIIENVQLKFCREFLGVNHSVNNCIALSECGRLPLCVIYKTKVVKYWCKLLRMDNHRFPKQCYKMLKAHADLGRINWVTQVKNLLCTNGVGYAWLSQDIGDIDHFVKLLKEEFPIVHSKI